MLLNNELIICDPFKILSSDTEQEAVGIITFQFTSRITGKSAIADIDVYSECLAIAISPAKSGVLSNRMALEGFRVSPLPAALKQFMHALLFPQNVITFMGGLDIEPPTKNADVIHIGSYEEIPYRQAHYEDYTGE